jgi:GNAT superfamily N-acetyltransferase
MPLAPRDRYMEYVVLGWPPDAPTLDLHHERFAYAGKFVVSDTGKAVARDAGETVAAVAFSPDRTDERTLRLRYVTVRRDRQGEGVGPRLCRLVANRATGRGFTTVLIAVNNPFAYVAAYRAGFAYTGETTGMAELLLEAGADRGRERYAAGLGRFADRDLPAAAREFVEEKREAPVPEPVASPG